jgi:L-idonate 5-dehydrogenase
MQAVVAHGAHDLRVEEVPEQPPGPDAVEVEIAVGGICGSDLHYFHRGGVADYAIREPLILGHEVAGAVVRGGDLPAGTRVAIDPSVPCGACPPCRRGARNLCADVRFLGSAARMPHSQGGFRERLVVDRSQCVPLPDHLDLRDAVFAEPLAVALHAVERAGPLLARDVLVTGAGPIGLLILVAAREAGARVTITDIADAPLETARALGATDAINVAPQTAAEGGPAAGAEGSAAPPLPDVDVAIEASAAAPALAACLDAVRPGGRVVLVGLFPPGDTPLAANRAVTREVELAGSFRFTNQEFRAAVALLAAGLDVSPLLSARFPFTDAPAAFAAASDRDRALKVQLTFGKHG